MDVPGTVKKFNIKPLNLWHDSPKFDKWPDARIVEAMQYITTGL